MSNRNKTTKVEETKEQEETTAVDKAEEETTTAEDTATETQEVAEEETKAETAEEEKPAEKSFEDAIREQFPFAKDWSDAEVQSWHKVMANKKSPYVDEDDQSVLVFDPKRINRKVVDWPTADIEAFLQGKLLHVSDQRRKDLVEEFKRRVSVDAAWSDHDILDYYRTGKEPAKTENGVWVRDVTRDKRQPSSWTDDELVAWAMEEIKSDIVSQKLVEEINRRFDLSIPNGTTDRRMVKKAVIERNDRLSSVEQKVTEGQLTKMNKSHIETVLDRYCEAVALGQEITDAAAYRAQNSLEALFVYVTNLDGQAMVDGLDLIKKCVKEHRKDVFSPSNAHRFTQMVKGDAKVKRRHINFIELFIVVTDTNKGRRKQVDFKLLLRDFSPATMERLHDYFVNYA